MTDKIQDVNIKISIVEDNVELCDTLARLIEFTPGLECISRHYNGENACIKIVENPPDIVLIDLGLPGKHGVDCIKFLKKEVPGLQFLVWTIKDQDKEVFDALKAGASGYLLKTAEPSEIIEGIRNLYDGGAPMSASVARKVVTFFQKEKKPDDRFEKILTSREKQVLHLLSLGRYYKEIAAELYISIETVKSHCHNIYEKLHVSSRTEALNKYYSR